MSQASASVAVSDDEYALHKAWKVMRPLMSDRYPRDIHSARRIREFVALADACAERGVAVVPFPRIEELLRERRPVLKFGKTDVRSDLALLERYPDAPGEWNARNLEAVGRFNLCIDLGRRTWNLFLGAEEHRKRLRRLFREHGRLFVKSLAKGHSGVYRSFEELMGKPDDLSRMSEESLDVLVSEVVDIRQIHAHTAALAGDHPDEWRHHVWRGRRIASTHAFECDLTATDEGARDANVAKAEAVIAGLGGSDFATTYVLDTCTLTDGSVAVIEANSFFSSGIYERSAVLAIAEAIATA